MATLYHVTPLPSERTLAQILARNGLTHGRTGWYEDDDPSWLPESAQRWKPQSTGAEDKGGGQIVTQRCPQIRPRTLRSR